MWDFSALRTEWVLVRRDKRLLQAFTMQHRVMPLRTLLARLQLRALASAGDKSCRTRTE
jgi:hypothetical protein